MLSFLIEYGLWGLFLASFLAATILPFSSEVVLVTLLYSGVYDPIYVLLIATIGNTLGGVTNYLLGLIGKIEWIERWLKVDHNKLISFQDRIKKYGAYSAFLCWIPIIGDPLAIALGWFRVPFLPVLIYMAIGKFLRYLVLTLPFI